MTSNNHITNPAIRTRFAPSPTGMVHLGSLRTTLFTFLFARNAGGALILRVEDTDQSRKVEGALENLIGVMNDMGIEFDEGFFLTDSGELKQKGEHGPYLQSERLDIYQREVQKLLDGKSAYYCFCSTERLDELRKEQAALKKPSMYDRLCRNLPDSILAEKLAEFEQAGNRPVIRQAIPLEGQTIVRDIIYGDIVFENKNIDDQVLMKSDGFPTYHLAVVVDDHYMDISHVIRGEEWINSTPKHILLYQAFEWKVTKFAHVPVILNRDKSKLSKRQGDVGAEDFIKKGYLKEALLNFLVFLGWSPKTEKEIFSLDELIEEFDLAKVNRGNPVFDVDKLDWVNGLYIRQMDVGALTDMLLPYWQEAELIKQAEGQITLLDGTSIEKDYLEAVTLLERDRLKKLSEIGERTAYFFAKPEYDASLLVWKKNTAEQTVVVLKELAQFFSGYSETALTTEDIEKNLKAFIAERKYDNGSVLWPLRTALTGMDKSPGPFEVAATLANGLGKAEVVARLTAAQRMLT